MSHLGGGVTADVDQSVRSELEQLPQEQLVTALPAARKEQTQERQRERRQ